MKTIRLILILLLSSLLPASAQAPSFNALPWNQSVAYNSYLMRTVHDQYRTRLENFDQACASKAGMQAYVDACKERYRSIAGEFPAKRPLNAQVVSAFDYPGLRVENILFESLPGRFVAANLYLPTQRNGRIPAALQFCGHGINGKASESPIGALLALNGIAVLVVDPIGQGEHLQLIDDAGHALTRGATTEHTLLNAGLNLLGTSLAAQEFWDNHRALDYLLTRPEIDGTRIGAYGSSGGGTQTAYFIGLDERVKVSAICSYFSQRERTLELQGASDGCQHIPYEGRERLELTDFALMTAPNPVLILSGKYDFVDLWGAQQGFAQLKQAYSALGIPERTDQLIVETGHGLGFEKQQRLIRWFRQWLLGTDDVLTPTLPERIDMSQLYATATHQANTSIAQAQSLMEENEKTFDALAAQRQAFGKQNKWTVKTKVGELLGLTPVAPLRIVPGRHSPGRDYEQYAFQLIREGEMPVPCVVLIPDKAQADAPIHLVLQESGKNAFLSEYTNWTGAVSDGTIVVVADLRGLGETADPAFYNDAKYWNFEYRNAMIAMHAGKPILGQRVQDILTLIDFCSTQQELQGHPIRIRATGLYGPAVVHAAFLDDRIASAELARSLRSWKSYLSDPLQYNMYSNVLYGVLPYYDLPDLIRLSGKSIRYTD
jgi:cephalosporin-C deacetylase-like acetyl esterase